MSLPLPSEFQALIPADPNNPTCEELRALMDRETGLQALLYRWWSYWFNEDGTLSESFTADICNADCGGNSSSSTPA
jgi:hypothetical protein